MAAPSFEHAVQQLYQASVNDFVDERKRLAAELKSAGDAGASKRLLARRRPTISAWVVNQLYWHARDAFDHLLATAEKLRSGDLAANAAHREALARLRARASTILKDAGHAPTESTLRRVMTTLSAIAVTGGFDPDPPGALAEDRDPPGFAAFGLGPEIAAEPATIAPPPAKKHEPAKHEPPKREPPKHEHAKHEHAKHEHDDGRHEREKAKAAREEKARQEAEHAAEIERAREEKRRAEAEAKRIAAERHRLETALRAAKTELDQCERDVEDAEEQLAAAKKAVKAAQETVDDLADKLEALDE